MIIMKCMLSYAHRKKERKNKAGFTLAELLIVVAIIAVLVAISIPIFTTQLHKARVATDWANIRSYYSDIQTDFITTGKFNANVPDALTDNNWHRTELDFLNGQKVYLKEGYFTVIHISTANKFPTDNGYQVSYYCNDCLKDWDKHKDTCVLILGS